MVRVSALKKRYIAFIVQTEEDLNEERLKHALYHEALVFFGEYGLSLVALKLISYDPKEKIAILRCAREYKDRVLGFLALVNKLERKDARTIAIASSGTLKALKNRIEIIKSRIKSRV